VGDDHVGLESGKLRGDLRQAIISVLRPAILDPDVATVDVPVILQLTLESVDARFPGCWSSRAQEANLPHLPGRLRLGGDRRGDQQEHYEAD
jgi:hypothetical protein